MEGDTTACPWQDTSYYVFTQPPSAFLEGSSSGLEWDVNFLDSVPVQAQDAILKAMDIWAVLLSSEVPIRVDVNWLSLEGNTLASAGPRELFRGLRPGVPDTWYPVALAEALVGEELNDPSQPDIVITANSNVNWYFGLDGNTPGNQFDLVTVILHELGHGLGFFSSSDREEDNNLGLFGFGGFPMIFDRFLTDGNSQSLLDTLIYPNRSVTLLSALTSNEVFFTAPNAALANNGSDPPLFAPREYDQGSSISHLDERSYPPGTPNTLMTPALGRAEAIHDPGPVTLAIFDDMGWPLNRLTGTKENPKVLRLAVFPNPAADRVQMRLPESGTFSLRVFDAMGRQVKKTVSWMQQENEVYSFEANGLAKGNYFLLIQGAGKQFVSKLMIE